MNRIVLFCFSFVTSSCIHRAPDLKLRNALANQRIFTFRDGEKLFLRSSQREILYLSHRAVVEWTKSLGETPKTENVECVCQENGCQVEITGVAPRVAHETADLLPPSSAQSPECHGGAYTAVGGHPCFLTSHPSEYSSAPICRKVTRDEIRAGDILSSSSHSSVFLHDELFFNKNNIDRSSMTFHDPFTFRSLQNFSGTSVFRCSFDESFLRTQGFLKEEVQLLTELRSFVRDDLFAHDIPLSSAEKDRYESVLKNFETRTDQLKATTVGDYIRNFVLRIRLSFEGGNCPSFVFHGDDLSRQGLFRLLRDTSHGKTLSRAANTLVVKYGRESTPELLELLEQRLANPEGVFLALHMLIGEDFFSIEPGTSVGREQWLLGKIFLCSTLYSCDADRFQEDEIPSLLSLSTSKSVDILRERNNTIEFDRYLHAFPQTLVNACLDQLEQRLRFKRDQCPKHLAYLSASIPEAKRATFFMLNQDLSTEARRFLEFGLTDRYGYQLRDAPADILKAFEDSR